MRRVFSYQWIVYLAVVAGSGACTDSPSTPGVPNLIRLEVVSPGGARVSIMPGGDAGVPPVVSPLASIVATFDALLDPSKVQDLSGATPALGRGVARVQWQGAAGPAELGMLAQYNPSKREAYGPAPTITFTSPQALPANVSLTLVLERTRITDKAGNVYVGVPGGTFETAAFTATVALPQGPQSSSFLPRISFTSLPGAVEPGAVSVILQGAAVPVEVTADPASPTGWIVSRAGQGVPWSPGAYQLVLTAEKIKDLFGAPLPSGSYVFPFTIGGTAVDGGALGDGGSLDSAPADAVPPA